MLTTVPGTPRLANECMTHSMIGITVKCSTWYGPKYDTRVNSGAKKKKSFYHQKIIYAKVIQAVHWCVQIWNKSSCHVWHITVLKSLFSYLHAWTLYTGLVCTVFQIMCYLFLNFLILEILIMGFSAPFRGCLMKIAAGTWMRARFYKLDLFKRSFSISACLALKT